MENDDDIDPVLLDQWKSAKDHTSAVTGAVVVGLHIWKKNTLLSIAAGTAAYMLLIQFVF